MKVSRTESSGYSINKSGTFTAAVRHKKVRYSLGTYTTQEDAIKAYKNALNIIKNNIDTENKLKAISKKKQPQKSIYYDKSKEKYVVNIRIGEYSKFEDAQKAKEKAFSLLSL